MKNILYLMVCMTLLAISCKPSAYNQRAQRSSQKKTKQTIAKAKSVEQKGKKDRKSNLRTTRKAQADQHENLSKSSKKKVSKNKISNTGSFGFY